MDDVVRISGITYLCTVHYSRIVNTILIILILCASPKASQADYIMGKDSLFVNDVIILGNNKTKERIILRELTFREGEKIPAWNLDSLLKVNSDYLFNLHLFLEVNVESVIIDVGSINIIIGLKERWYLLPSFQLELADRNINEWWKYGHDLSRINFGVAVVKQNCRGMNETFTVGTQFGFSSSFLFLYDIPYLDRNSKHGVSLGGQYLRNREFVYATDQGNRLLFAEGEDYIRKRALFGLYYQYRPAIKNTHLFDLSFHLNHIADTILSLNSSYINGLKRLNFFSLGYTFTRNNTDIHFYPNKGYLLSLSLNYMGPGMNPSVAGKTNAFDASGDVSVYIPLSSRFFMSNSLRIQMNSGRELSFLYAPNLGYEGNFVRSYEYYLIKGQATFLQKNEVKYRIVNSKIHLKFIPASKFNTIPVDLYLKMFGDAGYVYDQKNFKDFDLTNKLLYGGGMGIDLVSYYDIVFRVEYGINAKGEKGLFFHVLKAI